MRHNLDSEKIVESFFEQTGCIGIVTPVRGYHLCWMLNSLLDMDFRAIPDEDIRLRRFDRDIHFNGYAYVSQDNKEHFIYENKTLGGFLISEWKHVDFILLVKMDDFDFIYIHELLNVIRSIDSITMAMELTDAQLKNPENLLI